MINQFQAAKDCLDTLKAYTDANGYGLAVDGFKYEPEIDEIYFSESYLSNNNNQGLNNNSTQTQLPIYQVIISTPKNMGKFKYLSLFDEIKAVFVRHSDISTLAGQKIIIDSVDGNELPTSDTHNLYAVSIRLTVMG